MLDIRNALQMLQRALPNIPMGTPVWKDIYDAVGKLSKHGGSELPMGLMNQAALRLIRERSQNPLAGQMANMSGAKPDAAPAMPPPAAAA